MAARMEAGIIIASFSYHPSDWDDDLAGGQTGLGYHPFTVVIRAITETGERPPFLLVADDVIGGFFAINGGGLDSSGLGNVFYFAPENSTWTNLQVSYTQFLQFCFSGDLNEFYKGMRWKNWRNDVAAIKGDQGFSFYPLLWSRESKDNLDGTTKQIVPVQELWNLFFVKRN